jgi:hypothetical protein
MNATSGWATSSGLHVPLARLALCLDCETCFEVGSATCPACGSRMWASVARFLDRRHDP